MVTFCVYLLLLFSTFIAGDVNILVNPVKRCVATSTQTGACHVCVCTTDGVYHCRAKKCDENIFGDTVKDEKECEAHNTYRQDEVICSCDETGHWRSMNCRRKFHNMRPNTNLHHLKIGTNVACAPKHFYIMGCNICFCDDTGFINLESCTNRRCLQTFKSDACSPGDVLRTINELCICSDIDYFIDRLCLKIANEIIQEVKPRDLDKINEIGMHWDNLKSGCKPMSLYSINCNKCFCTSNGRLLCDEDNCLEFQSSISKKRSSLRQMFDSLPELKNPYSRCKPGSKYRFNCNTCICNNNREPICTTMVCLEDLKLTLSDLELISSYNDQRERLN